MRHSPCGTRGFTLNELIVTLAIIAVLATGVMPLAELAVQRAREQELRLALREIRSGIDAYKRAVDEGRIARAADATGYPPTLGALVQGIPDAKDPAKGLIHILRRLPRDPFHGDPLVPPADTWGVRSYASSADSPQAGKDVFDVMSKSEATGINGVPYREW